MKGLIQERPLLLSGVLSYAARHHGATPVTSRQRDGSFRVSSWQAIDSRVRQLVGAMLQAGIEHGDRVATLAWNNHRHLEVYFAASAIGAICHPINPRLFVDQIRWIAQHAEDRALFFDLEYASLAQAIASTVPNLRMKVYLDEHVENAVSDAVMSDAVGYEELLATSTPLKAYPTFDERTGASLCYTSGTTGNPKGVLSSHRALVLHALAARNADLFDLSPRSVACSIVPLYHAHGSWGLPFSAAMAGSAYVLPGLSLNGSALLETINQRQVTVANGVPTVWQDLLAHIEQHGGDLATLSRVVIAGAAPSSTMIDALQQRHEVEVCHIWGMTETGPCATSGALHGNFFAGSPTSLSELKRRQGHGLYGVEMRIVTDEGDELAWADENSGHLQVRGPFVISAYFKGDGAGPVTPDGWFNTGDVATISADGYLKLVDRAKDLVKSGGEWISSIDVENFALAHPDVAEAAVIAVPHARWGERPLLLVIMKPGRNFDEGSIRTFLAARLATWWVPDQIAPVHVLPRTGTGKLIKSELRQAYSSANVPRATSRKEHSSETEP